MHKVDLSKFAYIKSSQQQINQRIFKEQTESQNKQLHDCQSRTEEAAEDFKKCQKGSKQLRNLISLVLIPIILSFQIISKFKEAQSVWISNKSFFICLTKKLSTFQLYSNNDMISDEK